LAKNVFDYACEWWRKNGVPIGYDEISKAMRCEKVEDFDSLANQLENELIKKFGKFQAA
jgi:hypothetical protein